MTIEDRNAILLEKNGPIATITLNRPEKANAFRHGDYELLLEHIEDCEKDPSVRAVIVTGAGRSFSAGDDFEGYAGGPQEALTLNHPFYGALHRGDLLAAKSSGYRIPLQVLAETCMVSGKIYIGAVNGACWAPEMLNAFDFVLCAEHATFAQGDMMIGICPGGGSTQTLPRVVGRRHALDLLLRPRAISAEHAYRIGLVNEIVPAAELMDRAKALAEELSAYPEGAVKMTKLAVTKAPEVTLAEGMAIEQDCFVLSMQSGFIGGFARDYWDRKNAKPS